MYRSSYGTLAAAAAAAALTACARQLRARPAGGLAGGVLAHGGALALGGQPIGKRPPLLLVVVVVVVNCGAVACIVGRVNNVI